MERTKKVKSKVNEHSFIQRFTAIIRGRMVSRTSPRFAFLVRIPTVGGSSSTTRLITSTSAPSTLTRSFTAALCAERVPESSEEQRSHPTRAWEISAAEIQLETSIDGDTPGAFCWVFCDKWEDITVAVMEQVLDKVALEKIPKEIDIMQRASPHRTLWDRLVAW